MKWNNSFLKIYEDGIVGNCPYCGSMDTEYIFWENEDKRGSLNVWCNSCGERVHAYCGHIPQNRKVLVLKKG